MTGALRRVLAAVVCAAAVTVGCVAVSGAEVPAPAVQPAADATQFNAGNIISDEVFFNGRAMGASEIQSFVEAKNAGCRTADDGTLCLRDYWQATTARAADAYCDGYVAAAHESAAVILAKSALSCGVNPRVLLVMLQKEQGLVTGRTPTLTRYQKAMGFACPDTPAGCDAAYYGFQNQVYSAARQYKKYAANPGGYAYRAGRTVNVLYHPSPACGSAPVYIANQATAGLYIYTPYQPNPAALQAGYGSGDSCSAYGNRNFWSYFTDWFGSTQYDAAAATLPRGALDLVDSSYGKVTASGWTFDPDAPGRSISVHVYVDGVPVTEATADRSRSDIGAVYPTAGSAHGYSVTFPARLGTQQVCVYAVNIGAGTVDPMLGCATVDNQDAGMPRGSIDVLSAVPGEVQVSGWAFDPDQPATSLVVRAYVDGKHAGDVRASSARPDLDAAFGVGALHGFSRTLAVSPGERTVCLYAMNVGKGSHHAQLTCTAVQVPDPADHDPQGAVDVLRAQGGTVVSSGWVVDVDDLGAPVPVTVTIDGVVAAQVAADARRADVAAAVPGAGAGHGFTWSAVVPAGSHRVCLSAQNSGYGTADVKVLGCRKVTTVAGVAASPVGFLDSVAGGLGLVSVAGWVYDPDAPTEATVVHGYVDGVFAGVLEADSSRRDVGRAVPGIGDAHGISWTLAAEPGDRQVCLYALNRGAGSTAVLGCRTVRVGDPSAPVGSLDSVAAADGTITVAGWALDPDQPAQSIDVHVYVDAAGVALTARESRPDVRAAHLGAGAAHGWSVTRTAAVGTHRVCAYAINIGSGPASTLLGCRDVTVR